jgi:hypothetical protein
MSSSKEAVVRKGLLIPVALVVVVAAAFIGYQLYPRQDGQARVSASPTQSAAPSLSPTPPPSASPTSASARSPEELADRLGAALEASDWAAIEKLISPLGWIAAWTGSEATPGMSPAQAVAWLRQGAEDGRLAVTVEERPIRTRNQGPPYVTSVWRNFDSRSGGRRPSQNAWLEFRQHTDGNWYWLIAVYNPYAMPDGP